MSSSTAGNAPCCAPAEAIALESVSFHHGAVPAVDAVSLAVPPGAFVSILGPSGCGKTTLLKLAGGYLLPRAGRVFIAGRDATALPPEARRLGMVFQNLALFPHLSAWENIAFGLRVARVPAAEVSARVNDMLARVDITPAEAGRPPDRLSGGQRQRVALARALVTRPLALLLDEPMSSLDIHLRQRMRELILKLHRASGIATLMVTHDPAEALAMSDTLVVMNQGRVLEQGAPQGLYNSPKTAFTARLLGPANIVEGPMVGLPGGTRALIRPGAIELNPATSAFTRRVVVESVEFQGDQWAATLADGGFRWLAHGRQFPPPGTEVVIGAARIHPLPEADAP